ncbi:MAG: inverse autotransporter beta domain-containing protein, partial [Candidatus Porifericomitaceae bacterium WSBS_2022_MAG_OTU9]
MNGSLSFTHVVRRRFFGGILVFFSGMLLSIPGLIAGGRVEGSNYGMGAAAAMPLADALLPVVILGLDGDFPQVSDSRAHGFYQAVAAPGGGFYSAGAPSDATLPELSLQEGPSSLRDFISRASGEMPLADALLPVAILGLDGDFPQVSDSRAHGFYQAAAAPGGGFYSSDATLPELSSQEGSSSLRDFISRASGEMPQKIIDGVRHASDSSFGDAVATAGTDLMQSAIDHSLSSVEDQVRGDIVRSVNLSWSPGFADRASVLQLDTVVALRDSERLALMTQAGVQSRDGEAAANIGIAARTRLNEKLLLGANVFYDYLSEPNVDRWSVGVEAKGSWFNISSNYYQGIGYDIKGSQRSYSPDGWDIELAGNIPGAQWLQYSGRYYRWNLDGSDDLKGTDYKLGIHPVPLLKANIRYDNPQSGDNDIGFEVELNYQFARSLGEQLNYRKQLSNGGDNVWQQRFERVRREYEQRVQQRSQSATRRTLVASCSGSSCVVIIDALSRSVTNALLNLRGGDGRVGTRNISLLRNTGNCVLRGVANPASHCIFTPGSPARLVINNLLPGEYTFDVELRDSANQAVETVVLMVTVRDLRGLVSSAGSIFNVNEGGSASYTLALNTEPSEDVTIAITSSDPGAATATASLTFTPTDWATAQDVEVSGVEDDDAQGETVELSYIVSGGDYDGFVLAPQSVSVSDDDVAGLTVLRPGQILSGSLTVVEGGTAVYTLVLNTQPSGDVTIAITSSDPGAATATASLTFTPTDWATAQ